jgi:hypothetical protein
MAETFSDRPVIGRLRKLRETIREARPARTPEYEHEHENVVEYNESKDVETTDGRRLRLYYLGNRLVYVEDLGEAQPQTVEQTSTTTAEEAEVDIPPPPQLVKRERPRLRLFEGGVVGAVRKYVDSIAKERELELEALKAQVEHYKRVLQNPPKPKKPSESEARGGSHY